MIRDGPRNPQIVGNARGRAITARNGVSERWVDCPCVLRSVPGNDFTTRVGRPKVDSGLDVPSARAIGNRCELCVLRSSISGVEATMNDRTRAGLRGAVSGCRTDTTTFVRDCADLGGRSLEYGIGRQSTKRRGADHGGDAVAKADPGIAKGSILRVARGYLSRFSSIEIFPEVSVTGRTSRSRLSEISSRP